jgi:hypothetical protein
MVARLGPTIPSFLKAVVWVAMRGENGHLVASLLQSDSGINDQSLCPSDAQVRVKEDYLPLLLTLVRSSLGLHDYSIILRDKASEVRYLEVYQPISVRHNAVQARKAHLSPMAAGAD